MGAPGGAGGSGDDGASHGCPCGAGAQGGSAGAPGFGGGASLGGEPFYTPLPGAPTFTVNLYGGAGGSGGDGGLYRGASGRGSCQPRAAGFANLTNPPVVWEWAINPNPGCGGDGSPGPRCLP